MKKMHRGISKRKKTIHNFRIIWLKFKFNFLLMIHLACSMYSFENKLKKKNDRLINGKKCYVEKK